VSVVAVCVALAALPVAALSSQPQPQSLQQKGKHYASANKIYVLMVQIASKKLDEFCYPGSWWQPLSRHSS